MASPVSRQDAALTDILAREPHRVEFFRAVRALEIAWWVAARDHVQDRVLPGFADDPSVEIHRFHVRATLAFPNQAVWHAQDATPDGLAQGRMAHLTVTMLGMFGPMGALPMHYTELVVARAREKDMVLRRWLDIFNHRVLSYYYRAWEKHRLLPDRDRSVVAGGGRQDLGHRMLLNIAGARSGAKDDEVVRRTMAFYAGLFGQRRRCAASLRQLLQEFFGVAVQVEQFVGQWIDLPESERSRAPGAQSSGQNFALGRSMIAGNRVWDVGGAYELRIGPVDYRTFRRLIPEEGDMVRPLCRLARAFAGAELDFRVEVLLKADEVPVCTAGPGRFGSMRMGRNTWMGSAAPRRHPVAVTVKHLGEWLN